jgi:hypothetical protein
MRKIFERVGDGVTAVDTEFIRPRMDASHLIVDAGRAALHASIDRILEYKTAGDYLAHYTVDLRA